MAMMEATAPYNVEVSVNQWLRDALLGRVRPDWLPPFEIVFGMPETGLAPPCISVFHLGVLLARPWLGGLGDGRMAGRVTGLVDISCWASRREAAWAAQLSGLASMVVAVAVGTVSIPLADYTAQPGAPLPTGHKIDLGVLEPRPVGADVNADIERRRYVLRYGWTVRG